MQFLLQETILKLPLGLHWSGVDAERTEVGDTTPRAFKYHSCFKARQAGKLGDFIHTNYTVPGRMESENFGSAVTG